jgi:holliday junction DNA helicase RuvA
MSCMIATLRGVISEKLSDSLVLELGGIGYELLTTVDDWGGARLGEETRFYIYEQIREDAHNLYGFRDLGSRQLFVQLISISGVGPKVALAILSSAGEMRLRQAITSGDPALLRGISGVGPKTAQRVVLELRCKVELGGLDASGFAPVTDAAYQALVALGYTSAQASAAVAGLPADVTDDQARIKLALKEVR